MQYAILCYDNEEIVSAWTPAQEAAAMSRLDAVLDGLKAKGKLGPVVRLLPTSAAMTVRKGAAPLVLDGPFAETKEQLLGFYIVDCDTLDEALEVAKALGVASGLGGAHEVRPLMLLSEAARP